MTVTVDDVKKTIFEILMELDESIDPDALQEDVPFREQLELDSMDMLDVVLGLRRRYKLPIPDSDLVHLQTMESSVKYIMSQLND